VGFFFWDDGDDDDDVTGHESRKRNALEQGADYYVSHYIVCLYT
jgi:hypothetical protein